MDLKSKSLGTTCFYDGNTMVVGGGGYSNKGGGMGHSNSHIRASTEQPSNSVPSMHHSY